MQDLSLLTERLAKLNEDLARKMQARNEFDATIQETEAAYMKVRRAPPRKHCMCAGLSRAARLTNPRLCGCLACLALLQILESSQTLLAVLKRESASLTKRAA